MSKIWYCPNCGYEVTSRGRCHSCREKLVASALPQLAAGDDDDEVGYRVDTWADPERGRLIRYLNSLAILHRFEDDELVVGAEDEQRVDDLIAELSSDPNAEPTTEPEAQSGDEGADAEPDEDPADGYYDETRAGLRMLADAALRLQVDPTDMQADGDVAEASTAVFQADGYHRASAETWAAVGRVTRRLLSVLGAEEALEDDIRSEATLLAKLLAPILGEPGRSGLDGADESEQTVYELPEWTAEQRIQLGLLLEEAGIAYEWDHDELVVPADKEDQVEDLFGRVGVPDYDDDDDGEARYQAVAELFAATGRLASDPSDPQRSATVLEWVQECQGPPLFGMDEVDWFRIMSRAKALAAAIEGGDDVDLIYQESTTLHDLLRTVV